MSGFLRVKHWDKFQHYRDRSPPWIKLQRDLLRDYEFSCLQDASKLHLMLIWLLASQLDNKIPNDAAWIQRQIGTHETPNLNVLIDSGFLVLEQDASKALAGCKQSAMLETEAEAEAEEEKHTSESAIPDCPHEEIISIYHEVLGDTLPNVIPARWHGSKSERNLRARWKEHQNHRNRDWWRSFFEAVRSNDWWMGRKGWKGCNLHWLLERRNFDKVLEHWQHREAA